MTPLSPEFDPEPDDPPPLANILALRRDPLAFFTRMAAGGRELTICRLPNETIHLLNDPALIQQAPGSQESCFVKWALNPAFRRIFGEGLLNSQGERHRRVRRVTGPVLQPARLADCAWEMTARTGALLADWAADSPVELHREMTTLTLDIAVRTLFGVALETGSLREVGAAFAETLELSDRLGGRREDDQVFAANIARLDAIGRLILEARRQAGGGRREFTRLAAPVAGFRPGVRVVYRRAWFTEEQILLELRNFLIAGHATTAIVLATAFWNLARRPELQSDLRRNLDGALGDRLPSLEDLPALAPCEHVLLETLRLYPPVWVLGREARGEVRLGEHVLPKGAKVVIVPWTLHRDPVRFPEPEEFRPERWRNDARARLARGSFLPFPTGSRSCRGERFALLEGTLVLASLVQGWSFATIPGQPDPEWLPKLIFGTRRGVRLRATRRPVPALQPTDL